MAEGTNTEANVAEKKVETPHGEPNRIDYWRKEIDGKAVVDIAKIIADYEHRATRDNLTNLINEDEFKRQFEGFSDGAFRRGSKVFVLIFDYDNLKVVNDTSGYDAGNEKLKEVADVLKSSLRSSDLIARLHGDEFAGAVEYSGKDEDADKNMGDIIQRVVSNTTIEGVSTSVGIGEFKPGDNLGEVMQRAEKHMKMDKTDRKAGREFTKANV